VRFDFLIDFIGSLLLPFSCRFFQSGTYRKAMPNFSTQNLSSVSTSINSAHSFTGVGFFISLTFKCYNPFYRLFIRSISKNYLPIGLKPALKYAVLGVNLLIGIDIIQL
jgi:hypothetical protein